MQLSGSFNFLFLSTFKTFRIRGSEMTISLVLRQITSRLTFHPDVILAMQDVLTVLNCAHVFYRFIGTLKTSGNNPTLFKFTAIWCCYWATGWWKWLCQWPSNPSFCYSASSYSVSWFHICVSCFGVTTDGNIALIGYNGFGKIG